MTIIDYNLHNLLGVRLIAASPADAAAVTRQLGPMQGAPARAPEIVVRFVDRLPAAPGLRYVGTHEAAYTEDAFFVCGEGAMGRCAAQIPFARIGGECEILCETGLPRVPLLPSIVHLTLLAGGTVPMHASAFNYEGAGVVAAGWAGSSKTATLLAFMTRGAEYVGDEWVYLGPDGCSMNGVPWPMEVKDWYLKELRPSHRAAGPVERLRRTALRSLLWGLRGGKTRAAGGGRATVFARRLSRAVERRLAVHLSPTALFGAERCPLTGQADTVLFMIGHAEPGIVVRPADPDDLARRISFSLQSERLALTEYYLKFRSAFPGAANPLIDAAAELESAALRRALADKKTYLVHHGYPASLSGLFAAISPVITS